MSGAFDDLVPAPRSARPQADDPFGDLVPGQPAALGDVGTKRRTSNALEGARSRIYDVVGSGIRGIANVGERIGDSLESVIPLSGLTPDQIAGEQQLAPLFRASDFLRRKADEVGYVPAVDVGQAKAAVLEPITGLGDLVDKLGTAGRFALDRGVTSAGDMAASVGSLPAYVLARTQEIGERRVANDGRAGEPTLGDMAAALPAAVVESTLERFATRALPNAGAPTALGRIAQSIGLQTGTESAEEAIANLGESVGTARGVDAGELGDAAFGGALGGAAVGGGGAVASEINARRSPAVAAAKAQFDAEVRANPAAWEQVAAKAAADHGVTPDEILYTPDVPAEDTSDLDALLPTLGDVVTKAAATPEGQAALAQLGDLVAPAPAEQATPPSVAPLQLPEPAAPPALAPALPASSPATAEAPQPSTQERSGAPAPWKRQYRATGQRDSKGRPIRVPALDYTRDGLLQWLGAAGGVDFEQLRKQGGADPALLTDPTVMRPFAFVGQPAVRRKGGMSLDTLRERMQQEGWLAQDDPNAPPTVDNNDALDLVMDALSGRQVWHPFEGAQARAEAHFEQEREAAERGSDWLDLDPAEADDPEAFADTYAADVSAASEALQRDIDPEDADTALTLGELAQRALEAGVDPVELELAAADNPAETARRLWRMIQEPESYGAVEGRANQADTGGRLRIAEADAQGGEAAGFYALEAPPGQGRQAPQRQVAPVAGELFSPPTSAEQVAALRRQRTSRRNGGDGSGRTDMAAGDGELFAGTRPDQARIGDEAPAYDGRGYHEYLLDGRGQPREFVTLGAAREEADRVGGSVLFNGPIEGERPSWSVVREQVTAERLLYRGSAKNPRVPVETMPDKHVRGDSEGPEPRLRGPDDLRKFRAEQRQSRLGVEASRDMFVTTRGDREVGRDRQGEKWDGRRDADPRSAGPRGDDAGGGGRRPDATPALTRRGEFEVDALVRRFGGSVLADRIAREFRAADTAELIGSRVASAEDLAALAETYRNPIFETLRYIFVDDSGLVVGETAVSSRMPSSSALFPTEDPAVGMNWLRETARDLKATGLWLMHNHPSGVPTPSAADITITRAMANKLAGTLEVKGHVVLNHKRFATITPSGATEERDIARADESDPFVRERGLTGLRIGTPDEAAKHGAAFLKSLERGSVALMVIDARRGISLASAFPESAIENTRALGLLTRHGLRGSGSYQILALPESMASKHETRLRQALKSRALMDVIAVAEDGTTKSWALTGTQIGGYLGDLLGRNGRGDVAQRVYEEDGGYDLAGDSAAEVARMERGRRRSAAQAGAETRRNTVAADLAVSRGTAGWDYDAGLWIGRQGQLNRARADLQDKMLAWRDVQSQVESVRGELLPDAMNVYRLENLMHGRVARGIENIETQQVEPLVAAMKAAGVKAEALEEYLYARHAKERNAVIAEKNPAMPDGGSGMTDAEADAILKTADKAKLEPLARRVDAIVKGTRNRALRHGLLTEEAVTAMEAQYQHYVPLRGREVSELEFDGDLRGGMAGRGVDSRGKLVREALGRGAGNRAKSILAEVIGDAQRSIILAEKARVGRAALRIALANPNPAVWEVEPVQTERVLNNAGEVVERVINDWSDPSIVAVRHKGQLYKLQLSAPLAQAMNHVGVEQMNKLFRVGGQINRYFSAVLTKYNPAFTGANAIRDIIFGLTGMAAERGEGAALRAVKNYPQAVAAAWRLARNVSGDAIFDRYAKEFADAGGRTGYVSMPSVEDIARDVHNVTFGGNAEKVKRMARAVADVVGNANDAVENALRLSAFVTLREDGESAERAAEYAKNLTVNFNRKGYLGSQINAWLLFYNAAMQGAHRASKVMRNPKTLAYVGGMAAAQAVFAMIAMGVEDDDGEPLWNKVPEHVKRRNLVIVLPDKGVVTIPMPYGFNLLTYMGGRTVSGVMNHARGDTSLSGDAGAMAVDIMDAAAEAFVPIPVGDGVKGLMPMPLRIAANVHYNEDDFGYQIRRENPYQKGEIPRASMGKPDTAEVFKWTAKGLNRLGGGDDFTPPKLAALDRAPEDLEYLLEQVSGGLGKFVIDTATLGGKAMDPGATIAPRDVPLANRFRSNIDENASQRAMYYDRKAVIERNVRRVRSAFGNGSPAEVKRAEALMAKLPGLQGAAFKRRKKRSDSGPAGGVVTINGSPQLVVKDPNSVYGAFKAASKAVEARNELVEVAYAGAPALPFPSKAGHERSQKVREADRAQAVAQRAFTAAWTRDVVGALDE